jgi:UDP-glucose 4-epimerase
MADGSPPLVALTGAGGMVGTVLLRTLGATGFAVRRLSRRVGLSCEGGVAVLPPFDAPESAFDEALAGATHVVHAAGLTNADAGTDEADFLKANTYLTERLARAARRATPGHFVFISSIRAVAGQGLGGVIDQATEPNPACAYGRSKRLGELAATEAFGDAAHRLKILRPAPVYGPGMKGNLGRLLGLAMTPYPLPLGGLSNRRSLLDVEALARAVIHALTSSAAGAYVVSDREPVTVAGIVTAFRAGMGRQPGLFSVPAPLLEGIASVAGRRQALQGMFAEEICDPSALEGTGWIATRNSVAGLAALARPPQQGAKS